MDGKGVAVGLKGGRVHYSRAVFACSGAGKGRETTNGRRRDKDETSRGVQHPYSGLPPNSCLRSALAGLDARSG